MKQWWHIYKITYDLMLKKFFPHFVGYEEDLKQEMMVALVNAIKRIKRGEIRSEQNYIITHLKYETYKMAKKLIDFDRCTFYLEDMRPKWMDPSDATNWENAFKRFGITDLQVILSSFESYEERYMVMCLFQMDGYRKDKLRAELKRGWPYINKLEERCKERLAEMIKMSIGEHTNGK